MSRTVLVVGAGPGLGAAVARRFASDGDAVALFARSTEFLADLAADLRAETPGDALAVPTDVTDPDQVRRGVEAVRDDLGPVDVLVSTVYSDADRSEGVPSVAHVRETAAVERDGVLRCLHATLPDLRAGDRGDVVVVGSPPAVTGHGGDPAAAAARAGRRALLKSSAADLASDGVHVAHVVVDGWLDTPALREAYPDRADDAWMDTDAVADTIHHLTDQPASAWTFELDLRASTDDVGV